DQGKYSDAESTFQRSLDIRLKNLGPDHADVSVTLLSLGAPVAAKRNWVKAQDHLERGTRLIERARSRQAPDTLASGREGADIAAAHFNYSALVKVLHQRSLLDREAAADVGSKAFVASQWASSSRAAASVAQMAVRHAKGESALS